MAGSGRGSKTNRAQIALGLSDDFAQLADGALTGYPGDPPVLRTLHCANATLEITREKIELQSVRARATKTTPLQTTRSAKFEADIFMIGPNGDGFDSAQFDLLKLFLPVVAERSGSAAVTDASWTTTTLTLAAPATIGPGEGFEIIPATGGDDYADRPYVRFVTAVSGADVTFAPPLPAAIVALLNATAGFSIGYGNTYAVGESFDSSAVIQRRAEGMTKTAYGMIPESLSAKFVAGESAVYRVACMGAWGVRSAETEIGDTQEPSGDWLKVLNCEVNFADSDMDDLPDPQNIELNIAYDPKKNVTMANAIGASGMKRGAGAQTTLTATFGGYDFTQEDLIDARSRGIFVITVGSGTTGNTMAFAIMSAGRSDLTDGDSDDLLNGTISFVADEYNGDGDGIYTAGDIKNSHVRCFVAAGA